MSDETTSVPAAERRHPMGFGYIPDLPDFRDGEHSFRAKLRAAATWPTPPPTSDLRAEMPPHYDQGMHGTCVWQAVAAVIERLRARMGVPTDWTPSRLMGYYETRRLEGTVALDNGCQIRNAVKVAVKVGVCPERHWPYPSDDPDQVADEWSWVYPRTSRAVQPPPPTAYRSATRYQAVRYRRVDNSSLLEVLVALGVERHPIIIGFMVYQRSMYDARGPRPVVAMPPRHFLCRNSWGGRVQMRGDFAIPFDYLTDLDLASDAWIIEGVER